MSEPPKLKPFITQDEKYMITPYVLTYWDNEKTERFYENWDTLEKAQTRFTEILMGGNTNVCIMKRIYTVHFRDRGDE